MNSIETKLHVEIEDELDELYGVKDETKRKAGVDDVSKLLDRAIKMEELGLEHDRIKLEEKKVELERKKLEVEDEKAKLQLTDDRHDRLIKNGLTAAGIIIPAAITIWGTIKSIKFEETGTITTIMGRGFISKLLPKK